MKLPFIQVGVLLFSALSAQGNDPEAADEKQIMTIIDSVEKACKERTVYMIGRAKARRLAELGVVADRLLVDALRAVVAGLVFELASERLVIFVWEEAAGIAVVTADK